MEFVQRLLDTREKYTRIVDSAFHSDKQFHKTLREVCVCARGDCCRVSTSRPMARPALDVVSRSCCVRALCSSRNGAGFVIAQSFEYFMNLDSRCASFLALYVDEMMKHGFKGQSDEDVDAALEKVRLVCVFVRGARPCRLRAVACVRQRLDRCAAARRLRHRW